MRLRAWVWLALSSFLVSAIEGATRPRYGGSLTMQLSSSCAEIDTCDTLLPLVAETLVRLNQRGEFEPALAVTWQHDSDRKRWRFSLRPKVVFHDGEELNAAAVVPSLNVSLKKRYPDVAFTAGGQTLVIQSTSPMPDLLAELANPHVAIVRTAAKGLLIGTGPFRLTAWEPNRGLTLAAFDE
jgi:peptide/nickel transport system substrate-binding protein